MIIYFSGTGNSRYVAAAIADRLGDEVVNAAGYIKNNEQGTFHSEKPFVFVFPVYLSTAPEIFRKFILSSDFSGSSEAYFVPTCVGAAGSVPNAMSDVCRASENLRFMGCRKVLMPQNYIALFTMFDKEKREECYENAKETVNQICAVIAEKGYLDDKPASAFEYRATRLVEKLYNGCFTSTRAFWSSDSCIGCGACEKNCPTNSIEMKDGRPVWTKKHCIHCMACINRCPAGAIEYGNKTAQKPRYVCPEYNRRG